MKQYSVALEIAGPAAMFARPDTGSTPISYPVPTFSAAKGIFEAILRRPQIRIVPTMVETCRPVYFESYVTNYRGPATGETSKSTRNFQHHSTILVNVCFRLYADPRELEWAPIY